MIFLFFLFQNFPFPGNDRVLRISHTLLFYIAPLGNPLLATDKLESALKAVHSEYKRNFGKNSRTTNQLVYLSANPDHPYNG